MFSRRSALATGVVLVGVGFPTLAVPLTAQTIEAVGTRALGMAGAFVAVADDTTAVYWNPAGLAVGPAFGLAVEGTTLETGADDDERKVGAAATRTSSRLIAASTLPLGISYYRVESLSAGPAGGDGNDTQEVSALTTDHVGASLVQSLGSVLAVGATFKLVRGGAAAAVVPTGNDPLERAEGLDRVHDTVFDLDVGAIATLGSVRLGLVVRNLREPGFSAAGDRTLTLERQARAGFALFPSDRIVLSVDADLSETRSATGNRRALAGGVETWWARRRLGVRGGVRVATTGEADPVGAAGLSVGIARGFWVDGQVTTGDAHGDRGWSWGLAGRYGF